MNETLNFYNENAKSFIAGTVDIDMSCIHKRFLEYLPEKASILDLGCGSGRDSKVFADRGYDVTAVDGSAELCKYAEQLIGIPVRCLLFENLDYTNQFDGIWASASLLHVEKDKMQAVLRLVADAMKENGILFASYKYGTTQRVDNGRFYSDYTEADIPALFPASAKLSCIDWWITNDARPDQSTQKWLNVICKRCV